MSRAIYSNEMADPDVVWLILNFEENHPGYVLIEQDDAPLVFVKSDFPKLNTTNDLEQEQD